MVAAGFDHDLINIYCSQIRISPQGEPICNFLVEKNFTKKVIKTHIHPKYEIPKPEQILSDTLEESSLLRTSFDIALLEVEPFHLSDELNILPGCLFESDAHSFEKLLAAGLFLKLLVFQI